MESACTVLLSSDIFKVVLGAVIGLAGTLIVTAMTYRLEKAKMKANHRALIIKEAQLTAHDYFTSIRYLIVKIKMADMTDTFKPDDILNQFKIALDEMSKLQKEMTRKSAQLKSIGLNELALKASACVKPMSDFVQVFLKNSSRQGLDDVAEKINILEDVFLDGVYQEYKKLKL
jgi:hypothetical protein